MIDLSKLHPTFRRKVEAILRHLRGHGPVAIVASGFRTPEEQARLCAVGMGTPGEVVHR